jgi:isopenicillin-N N-acyltransferase-like protein
MLARKLKLTLLDRANVDIEYVCTDLDRHASKHVLLADRNGNSVSLELGPGKHTFVHDGKFGSLARFHTNHFHSWPYWRKCSSIMCRYRGGASPFRLRRLGEFLERTGDERLTALEIKAMFSDHERGGSAMCQHGDGDGNKPDVRKTVALVMYDTHRKVVSVCKGPPCKGNMVHFAVRQSKPLPDLPVPGASPMGRPIVPIINTAPAVDTAVAALRDLEVQLEMARPRDAAGNRQICNTPESDRESKRRRLNNSPVSDLAQDEI